MLALETARLLLRDYTVGDEDAYYHLKSDEGTMRYLRDIQISDRAACDADLRAVLADRDSPDRSNYFLHMERKSDGVQVGCIGYTVLSRKAEGTVVHVGYFSYPQFWGQGYMTEALQRLIRFAFEENGVYRLETGCLRENGGSEQVMRKCGLIHEATYLDPTPHEGQRKTRVEYRLLRPEWEQGMQIV